MKVVILAGGYGTRIAEETDNKPKPMVEIGGMPILLHIMKYYSFYGHNDFIICCGYKHEIIENYFNNSSLRKKHGVSQDWNINLINTGEKTMTGGRLKRIEGFIDKGEDFLFTYGDGLSDVNIDKLTDFHKSKNSMCTVTAVFPPSRFGALEIDNEEFKVLSFREKPHNDTQMINGGYFVLNQEIFKFIDNDQTVWEKEPMERIVKIGKLYAYKHRGFFGPMDTLREKRSLENMWLNNKAQWKIWSN